MATKSNARFLLLALILCLFLKIHYSVGADTISANNSVLFYRTVVSAGGIFELGFFRPGISENAYIGMWYKNDPARSIVWVANRDEPVTFSYAELRISDGNLVLFNGDEIPIWSTNVSSNYSSVQAVLQDDGNLVLNDGSNSSQPLWQSFDHPAHAWLPGSKIGFNKKTKTSTLLTSWKNSTDPAPGLFSLELNANDISFIFLWNRSKAYWTSGSWEGERFSSVLEMSFNDTYNYSYVSNENESYFTYSVSTTDSTAFLFIMDVSGQTQQLRWLPNAWVEFWPLQPRQQCEVYAFCGAYGICSEEWQPCTCLEGFQPKSQSDWDLGCYSGGCTRKTELQCGNTSLANSEKDGFREMHWMSLPEDKQSVQAGSEAECESYCLNNCSCTAYVYDSNGCLVWTEDILNIQQLTVNNSRGNLFIRLAASELQNYDLQNHEKTQKHHVLLGIVGAAVAIFCIASSVLRSKILANRRGVNQEVGLYDTESHIKNFINTNQFREDDKKSIDVPFVVLDSIRAATDNFSEANKLGRGGFGPVYKGKFPGGKEMAIKKLSSCSGQGLEEFKNEVLLIAKLQHRNLVRLLGYCVEGDEKMLLYEYMPNKSLDCFLFDGALCVLLDWKMRFSIILGIARGLVYLHHDSRLRIIHRDLKASNILLDEDMNPKISDFGLARIFGGKQTEASTRRVVGTYGYMSPEYALDGIFSIKSDVFSFGVVILEICEDAWKLWKENRTVDLMDATLHETCNTNEFLRCFNVGLLCVQEDPSDRPTISDVVSMLGSEIAILPRLNQPAFVFGRSLSSAAARSKLLSVNEITVSTEQGR
ncbi:hypothetical protein UlMin_014300 [Ulmus minor]